MKININTHSSIQVDNMAFDPFDIKDLNFKAKYIFLTHTHYDHLDLPSIKNITTSDTTIIATHDAKNTLEQNLKNKIIYIKPNDKIEFEDIKVETFPAYNINKNFHKKEFNWVGYKITKNEKTFAVLGDTDVIYEHESLKNLDVLFVPIGGTYTMNASEAAKLVNKIKPKLVIPVHYGTIVGTKSDETEFLTHIDKDINFKILI